MISQQLLTWAIAAARAIEQQPNKLKRVAIIETRPYNALQLDQQIAELILDDLDNFVLLQAADKQIDICKSTKVIENSNFIHKCVHFVGHTGLHKCSCKLTW